MWDRNRCVYVCVCEKHNPFTCASALQPCSGNYSPANDLVLSKPSCPGGLLLWRSVSFTPVRVWSRAVWSNTRSLKVRTPWTHDCWAKSRIISLLEQQMQQHDMCSPRSIPHISCIRPVVKSSIRKTWPSSWVIWTFKGHFEVNVSIDSGIWDPRFERLQIEITRTDRTCHMLHPGLTLFRQAGQLCASRCCLDGLLRYVHIYIYIYV